MKWYQLQEFQKESKGIGVDHRIDTIRFCISMRYIPKLIILSTTLWCTSLNAASMWEIRTSDLSQFGAGFGKNFDIFFGDSLKQAKMNYDIIQSKWQSPVNVARGATGCSDELVECKFITWCPKPGWFALVRSDAGATGVSCGGKTKKAAIDLAKRQCSKYAERSNSCHVKRFGFEDGRSVTGITKETVFMCSKHDTACGLGPLE